MNLATPYAVSLVLICAVSCAASAAEQSPKLVVTEGHSIGYATVADALTALKSQGLAPTPGSNGNVSFVEPDNRTAWTFTGAGDPAYPSAVRYVYTKSSDALYAEVTILCEASAERCEKFRSGIRESLAQLSKRMAGDPSAKCAVTDDTLKCGAEAERKPADQQLP
jgi:hypothetical protein